MSSLLQHVTVALADRSYEIRIGDGILPDVADVLPADSSTFLIVTDENVQRPHAETVLAALRESGRTGHLACVPAGEPSKSLDVLSGLYDRLVDQAASRRTVVVAVGGGVVGDLAGFLAATYARGLPFVQVPTTLLAMVDSSVGGKTGINHPQGKNLIGSFHQPCAVTADTSTLDTLPDREFRAGLAEVIKYGVILDADFFEWLETHIERVLGRDAEALGHVVARSCQLKAAVVRDDEFETTGLRAILNYGHTFAHAFEALSGYGRLLHGEAVAIGMVCASRLAEKTGRVSPDITERQIRLLTAAGLPVDVPDDLRSQPEQIVRRMLLDKKTVDGRLRFILPDRLGHVELVGGISPETALECLSA